MKKSLSVLFLFSILHLAFIIPTHVFADTCTTQYGGSTTCTSTDLSINKQVEYPTKPGVFVENITEADTSYGANMEVLYRLLINNMTGRTLSQVTIRDVLPQFLTFVSGPGTYNYSTKTLTFTIDNLATGTTTVNVLTKVAATVPSMRNCEQENTVTVTGPDNRSDSDRARICIAQSFSGTKELPVAGFNDFALILPFIGTGLGGLALLRKKS